MEPKVASTMTKINSYKQWLFAFILLGALTKPRLHIHVTADQIVYHEPINQQTNVTTISTDTMNYNDTWIRQRNESNTAQEPTNETILEETLETILEERMESNENLIRESDESQQEGRQNLDQLRSSRQLIVDASALPQQIHHDQSTSLEMENQQEHHGESHRQLSDTSESYSFFFFANKTLFKPPDFTMAQSINTFAPSTSVIGSPTRLSASTREQYKKLKKAINAVQDDINVLDNAITKKGKDRIGDKKGNRLKDLFKESKKDKKKDSKKKKDPDDDMLDVSYPPSDTPSDYIGSISPSSFHKKSKKKKGKSKKGNTKAPEIPTISPSPSYASSDETMSPYPTWLSPKDKGKKKGKSKKDESPSDFPSMYPTSSEMPTSSTYLPSEIVMSKKGKGMMGMESSGKGMMGKKESPGKGMMKGGGKKKGKEKFPSFAPTVTYYPTIGDFGSPRPIYSMKKDKSTKKNTKYPKPVQTKSPSTLITPTTIPTLSPTPVSSATIAPTGNIPPVVSTSPTVTSVTVRLLSRTLLYTIQLTSIPSSDDIIAVGNVTDQYLNSLFLNAYPNMTQLAVSINGSRFSVIGPTAIDYDTTAIFPVGTQPLPTEDELNQQFLDAFSSPQDLAYLTLLQALPTSNVFSTTSNVTVDTSATTPTTRGSSSGMKATFIAAAGATAFIAMIGGLLCFQHRNAPTNAASSSSPKGGKFSRMKATSFGYCRLQNAGRKLASYVTVAGDTYTGTATVWSGTTEQKTGTINESPYLEDDALSIGETSQWTNTQNDDHDGLNDTSYVGVNTEDIEISNRDPINHEQDSLYVTEDANSSGFQQKDEELQYAQQSHGLDEPYSNPTDTLQSPDETDVESVHVTQSLLGADYTTVSRLDRPLEQDRFEIIDKNDNTKQSRVADLPRRKNTDDEYTPINVGDLIKRFSSKRQER